MLYFRDSPTESSPKRSRQSNLLDKVSSCLFATCCYHRCTWPSYVGRDFFERYGVTPLQFHRLCKMAAWATCAFHKRNGEILYIFIKLTFGLFTFISNFLLAQLRWLKSVIKVLIEIFF